MAVERQQLYQLLRFTKFFYATKAVGAFFYDLSLTKTNLRAGWEAVHERYEFNFDLFS